MHDYKLVRVSEHGFGLFDRGEVPIAPGEFSNGLLRSLPVGALLYTGISVGSVRLAAEISDTKPDYSEIADWDDVVEVSVRSEYGQLCVDSYEDGPVAGLPILSSQGSGWYRVRAHARNRDQNYDSVNHDGAETYLLMSWPEESEASDVVLRATDSCGRQLRLAAVHTPEDSLRMTSAAGDEERERAHQALLEAQNLGSGPAVR